MPTGNGKVKLFLPLTLRGMGGRGTKKHLCNGKWRKKNHALPRKIINTLASAKEFAEKNYYMENLNKKNLCH